MLEIQASSFLSEIGTLGKKTQLQLPDNVLKEWQPQGQSLQEINSRREQIRKLAQEYNSFIKSKVVTSGGGISTQSDIGTVPARRKWFLSSCNLAGFSEYASAITRTFIGIYDSNSNFVSSLVYISFPQYLATATENGTPVSVSMSFPVAIPILEGYTVRLGIEQVKGQMTATIQGWEEDA